VLAEDQFPRLDPAFNVVCGGVLRTTHLLGECGLAVLDLRGDVVCRGVLAGVAALPVGEGALRGAAGGDGQCDRDRSGSPHRESGATTGDGRAAAPAVPAAYVRLRGAVDAR
jgi:hypothetical protein